MRRIQLLGTIGAVILAAACGKDYGSNTGPADPKVDGDVATAVGEAAAQDVDVMRNPGLASDQAAASANDWHLNLCVFDNGEGRFLCPVIHLGGLTFTRSYAFFDAQGGPMSEFDATLTASANVQSSLSGDLGHGSWSASVDWNRDFTVSGLAGAETSHTWNGEGNGNVATSRHVDGSETRTYSLIWTTTVDDVVIALAAGSFPTSGTITKHVTVTFVGGPRDGQTIDRTVTVTFDGTQNAALKVGGSRFDLNLATHLVTKSG